VKSQPPAVPRVSDSDGQGKPRNVHCSRPQTPSLQPRRTACMEMENLRRSPPPSSSLTGQTMGPLTDPI
jgi:hypothetical protein